MFGQSMYCSLKRLKRTPLAMLLMSHQKCVISKSFNLSSSYLSKKFIHSGMRKKKLNEKMMGKSKNNMIRNFQSK
jgi:hypothetical protein